MDNPTIRILQPGDQPVLETYLQPLIESSMFLVGNSRMAGLVDQGRRLQGTYAAAFSGRPMIGVVAHYWNGNLVLQAPLELLETLCRTAVSASQRPIQGIIGPKQQAQTALDSLGITPAQIQIDEPEFLYSLRLADLRVPPPLKNGDWHGRLINPDDFDLLTRWRVGYALETLGETDTPQLWQNIREGLERTAAQGSSWILEDRGQPVATSSFNTRIAEMVQVGGVWTPPELRSRGYGRGVVATSLLDALEDGAQSAILFTGETNYPAQKAYTALGFRHIGDYRIIILKTKTGP